MENAVSVRNLFFAFFQRYCDKNKINYPDNPAIYISQKLDISVGMAEKFFSPEFKSLKIDYVASFINLLELTVDERIVLFFALFEDTLPGRVQKLVSYMPMYKPVEETKRVASKGKGSQKESKFIHASGNDWEILKKVSEACCNLTHESKIVLDNFIATKGTISVAQLIALTNSNSARSIFTYMEAANREIRRVMEKTTIETEDVTLFKITGDTQAQTNGFTLKKKTLLF